MLYFGPGPDGVPAAPWADSNGNAAGSSPEDAVVQGFLELVERDAVALWWYNRTRHARGRPRRVRRAVAGQRLRRRYRHGCTARSGYSTSRRTSAFR